MFNFPLVGRFQQCKHGYHHPPWAHSCDGYFCDDERDGDWVDKRDE